MRRSQIAITVQAVHNDDVLEIIVTNNTAQRIKVKSICFELSDSSPLYVVERWCKMSVPINLGKHGSFSVPFDVIRRRKAQGYPQSTAQAIRVEDNDGNLHVVPLPDKVRNRINSFG
jgi:hypothetical protein